MSDKEIASIVEATITKLQEAGLVHSDCPLKDVEPSVIECLAEMPSGAFTMLRATWRVLSKFGDMAGHAIAVGAFIVIIALLCVGGIALLKLGEFAISFGK